MLMRHVATLLMALLVASPAFAQAKKTPVPQPEKVPEDVGRLLAGSWQATKMKTAGRTIKVPQKTMLFTFNNGDWTWKVTVNLGKKSKVESGTWTVNKDHSVTTVATRTKKTTKMKLVFRNNGKLVVFKKSGGAELVAERL